MAYVPIKSGFAVATILAATFGFATLAEATPLAGTAEATILMHKAQIPDPTDGLIQKAYHKGCPHKVYYHHHHVSIITTYTITIMFTIIITSTISTGGETFLLS